MKKLVLLLEKPQADFHLSSILILSCLTDLAISNLLINLFASFTYILSMIFYSYSSGFIFVRNLHGKILNSFLFFLALFISLSFVSKLFFTINILYYLGKINVSEKELLNIDQEALSNIFNLFVLTIIVWLFFTTGLRRRGMKSALKLMQNEKTPQT